MTPFCQRPGEQLVSSVSETERWTDSIFFGVSRFFFNIYMPWKGIFERCPLCKGEVRENDKYQRLQRGKNGLIEPCEMAGFVGAELKIYVKMFSRANLVIFVV